MAFENMARVRSAEAAAYSGPARCALRIPVAQTELEIHRVVFVAEARPVAGVHGVAGAQLVAIVAAVIHNVVIGGGGRSRGDQRGAERHNTCGDTDHLTLGTNETRCFVYAPLGLMLR